MNATRIDGKAFATERRQQLKTQITLLKQQHNITPGLAVVLVGNNPASEVYVTNKSKQAQECGLNSFEYRLNANTSEAALLSLIDELNIRTDVHGILVQLPLPKHINTEQVLNHIIPAKDVDGFHPINVGKLSIGENALIPCTPLGCLLMLKYYVGDLTGKEAVIIGRSNIVGKPMMQLLLKEHCTVTIVHSRSRNIAQIVQRADIVIAAVGQPRLVTADWIKSGAIVIDVGINRIQENGQSRLVGDVDFEQCQHKASLITPVPGGVGPMTIACLLQNTLTAACQQNQLPDPNQIV